MKVLKIQDLKKIKNIIWGVYYEGVPPEKFGEATGIDNYIEELYPEDPEKFVGDWIEEHFGSSMFFDTERIKLFYSEQADLVTSVFFYSNLEKYEKFKSDRETNQK